MGVGPGGAHILDQVGIFADLEKRPAANRDTVLQDFEGRKLATMESRVLRKLGGECISCHFIFVVCYGQRTEKCACRTEYRNFSE